MESILYGFWAIILVFFSCEIGQRFTDAYEEIDDKIESFDWYLLPMKIQRMLLILMVNTQQVVYIECFGSMACGRDTFKKVKYKTIRITKKREFIHN